MVDLVERRKPALELARLLITREDDDRQTGPRPSADVDGTASSPATDARRCCCCPYGYHIDRGFLGCCVRPGKDAVELRQLKRIHRKKMRFRQEMESLLMQNFETSGYQRDQPEPATPTSDAGESDRSTDDPPSPRSTEGTDTILAELDEAIAEALRSIDDLMNSKRKSVDNGADNSTLVSSPRSASTPPCVAANRESKEAASENGTTSSISPRYRQEATGSVVGNGGPFHVKPVDDSARTHSEGLENAKATVRAAVSKKASKELTLAEIHFPGPPPPPSSGVADERKSSVTFAAESQQQAVRQPDDVARSSDLAKALAVLLPYDGKVSLGSNSEALTRLRQYVGSSLRHMRKLEQQLKAVPVMQVRISVLKEEKKLLRLQLLSLQNACSPSTETGPHHNGANTMPLNQPPPTTTTTPPRYKSFSATSQLEDAAMRGKHIPGKDTHGRFYRQLSVGSSGKTEEGACAERSFRNFSRSNSEKFVTQGASGGDRKPLKRDLESGSLFSRKKFKPKEDENEATSGTKPPSIRLSSSNDEAGDPGIVPAKGSTYSGSASSEQVLLPARSYEASGLIGAREAFENDEVRVHKVFSSETKPTNFDHFPCRSAEKLVHSVSSQNLASSSSSQERPRTFNEPVRIRKVTLARSGGYASPPPPPPPPPTSPPPKTPTKRQVPPKQRFNAAIQCELLSTKAAKTCVAATRQCACVTSQKYPSRRDAGQQTAPFIADNCHAVAAEWGLMQAPDVNATAAADSRSSGMSADDRAEETQRQPENGVVRSPEAGSPLLPEGRAIDEPETLEVGVVVGEKAGDAKVEMRSEEDDVCVSDRTRLKTILKDALCQTDAEEEKPSRTDASCLTDEKLFKEVGCTTDDDVTAFKVQTLDKSCSAGESAFDSNSPEVGRSTDETLKVAFKSEAGACAAETVALFTNGTTEVGRSTARDGVLTADASCFTDDAMFARRNVIEAACGTDEGSNVVPTADVCCFTESAMFKPSFREIACSTDEDICRRNKSTRDASCSTDSEMFESQSREVACLTDEVTLPPRKATRDVSCLTEEEEAMLRPPSREVGCSTDRVVVDPALTKDASCSTEAEMFETDSKEVGCSTDPFGQTAATSNGFKGALGSTEEDIRRVSAETTSHPNTLISLQTSSDTTPSADGDGSNPEESRLSDGFSTDGESTGSVMAVELSSESDWIVCEFVDSSDNVLGTCRLSGSTSYVAQTSGRGQHVDFSRRTPDEINNNNNKHPLKPVSMASVDGHGPTINDTPCATGEDGTLRPRTAKDTDAEPDERGEGVSSSSSSSSSSSGTVIRNQSNNTQSLINDQSSIDNQSSVDNQSSISDQSSIDDQSSSGECRSSGGTGGPFSKPETETGSQTVKMTKEQEEPPSQPKSPSRSHDGTRQKSSISSEGKSFLTEEMMSACKTYSIWLRDSDKVKSKQLNDSLSVIQTEWFSTSSQKTSTVGPVKQLIGDVTQISLDICRHMLNMFDKNENTALHYAVSNRNFDLVDFLLGTGYCDVNRRNRAGCTAVMLASLVAIETGEQRAILRSLIEASDVNVSATLTGQTALMLAASRDHRDTVRMLLEAKADPNLQDVDGSTALMCASEHGYVDVVKILLSHPGCDPCLRDSEGSTALSIAMEAGHPDIGVILYAHTNFRLNSPQHSGRRRDRTGISSNQRRK